MKFRAPILLLSMALPLALLAAEEAPTSTPTPTPKSTAKSGSKSTPASTPKPTILKRWIKTLGLEKDPNATGFRGLDIALKVDPAEVAVGDTKKIKATVTLTNRAKKITQLEFPTSQRIEVLVKSKEGKIIEQWSEDQAFSNEPTSVTINPDERLEYGVSLATRDMVAGATYTVEAFFPNFEQLRKSITIAAVTPPPATPAGATPAPGTTPVPGASATPEPKKHKK